MAINENAKMNYLYMKIFIFMYRF